MCMCRRQPGGRHGPTEHARHRQRGTTGPLGRRGRKTRLPRKAGRRSAEAAGWYTRAIEADGDASSAGEASSNGAEVAVLRSNRSAAFMKLGANSEALAEARRCVKLDASFVKGYLRLGEALGAMGRLATSRKKREQEG